ncbi:MAG: hypothetical protein HY366_00340 [Candidatus Aenigmarchaeota archaeon]|nr:hypothetical protein [Candidatus Aenigmarchaeota archaeon]
MALRLLFDLAEERHAFLSEKRKGIKGLRYDHSVPTKTYQRLEWEAESEDERETDVHELAMAAILQTPLAQNVAFASSLGFRTGFRPTKLAGYTMEEMAKEGSVACGLEFSRPAPLDDAIKNTVVGYALLCLETEFHINNLDQEERQRFFAWMSPYIFMEGKRRGRFVHADSVKEAACALNNEYQKGAMRPLYKLLDRPQQLKAKVRDIVKGNIDYQERVSLRFDMNRDGSLTTYNKGRADGVSFGGPYGLVANIPEGMDVLRDGRAAYRYDGRFVGGSAEDVRLGVDILLKEADKVLRMSRESNGGYSVGLPGYVKMIDARFA